jgi:DNA polymerase-3 subunit epsilon
VDLNGPAGLGLASPDGVLLTRARELLASGPADDVRLIEYVCRLPGAPRTVAEHMARALFAGAPAFVRDSDGRWSLCHDSPVAAASGGASAPLHALRFVVVDVETTGTSPEGGDRITEIAAVAVQGGEVQEVFETLVNPERPIPPFITALTRITWDMVRAAPRFREVAPQVAAFFEGRLFVAHNAAFDWRFVSSEMARATGRALVGERLCTVRLARALLPQLRRRSLDALTNYLGIEVSARHRAAGDAVATARVLLRLLQEAESRGVATLADLRLLGRGGGRRRRPSAFPRPSDGDDPA